MKIHFHQSCSNSVHPAIHQPNPNLTIKQTRKDGKKDGQDKQTLKVSTNRDRSRAMSQMNARSKTVHIRRGKYNTLMKIITLQN